MSIKLFDILPAGFDAQIYGSTDIEIMDICIDSRFAKDGALYAAFRGSVVDGHDFIDDAVRNGAICIVCESVSDKCEGITYIVCEDIRGFIGILTHAFYGNATDDVCLVGVTGTNGKTTIATLLYQLLSGLGYTCGLISTVENIIGNEVVPATHTTPDVISLHKLIVRMKDAGCKYIFMEVSSHAAHQKRIAGLKFKGGVFTNLTLDHLDYHGTMLHYINAKKAFFDLLPKDAFVLVNADDKNGLVMLQNTKAKKLTYAVKSMADYKIRIIENSVHGLHIRINEIEAHFRMIGAFNAFNIAAVYGVTCELGIESDEVLALMSGLKGANGRFDQVIASDGSKIAIVDYAHTPDALENVLDTVNEIKNDDARIVVVVGCGGDRDKSKRPLMGNVACSYGEVVIFTSDNPRSEDPESILDDMEAGLSDEQRKKMIRISDRKAAIKTAVMMANSGDIIVVAGKGHENYQEIKGEKFPFDDKLILQEFLG